MREDVVDKVDCGLIHSSTATTRTEPAFFAGKRDEVLVLAGLAFEPQEPVGENSAFEIFPKLFFHEIRQWMTGFPLNLGQKSFQIFGDDLIKETFIRAMPFIGELFCRSDLGLHPPWDCKPVSQQRVVT